VIRAAIAALGAAGLVVEEASRTLTSAPLGPSRRRYANAAVVAGTMDAPEAVLDRLQEIEHSFGRRRRGTRWGARVLDLDIVLWSGGPWASERLVIPHPEFRSRAFVLAPAAAIAAGWRDPVTGRTLRQLCARRQLTAGSERYGNLRICPG
jgi:2-amino-4-hydroxy-6-hydroxymethyldihydropteridine diphosphokinase